MVCGKTQNITPRVIRIHLRATPVETPPFIIDSVVVMCRVKKYYPKSKARCSDVYLVEEEYLVTALVPSDTACLASSPGRIRRTEVWISREEMVDFLL